MPSLKEIRSMPPSKHNELRLRDAMLKLGQEEVEGLDELIREIKNLKNLENYEKLLKASKDERYDSSVSLNRGQMHQVPLLRLAHENLGHSTVKIPILTDLISFKELKTIYFFIECFYYINIERKLKLEDIQKIYFARLDERIISALDKFDEVSDVPKPTKEYIQKLKQIKWASEESKNFFKKIRHVMMYISLTVFSSLPMRFTGTEMFFNVLLAGCNAVNDDRDMITKEDMVIAYGTYLKLMKTDIPKLIDEIGVEPGKLGYLICKKCRRYYQLQLGELPDDFTKDCECGGKLRYYGKIDWLL